MEEPPALPQFPKYAGHLDLSAGAEPHTRAGAQALARKTFGDFGRYVQNFQRGDIGEPDLFYTAAHYSGWPGLCQAEAVSVSTPSSTGLSTERRYLVVGSFTSPPVTIDRRTSGFGKYHTWESQIEANCAAREASSAWFTAHDTGAWLSARLFDTVIAAARGGSPAFSITCSPDHFVEDRPCGDPRGMLARLAPNDIDTIEGKTTVGQAIGRRETTVSTHGDPYSVVVIRQEFATTPGKTSPETIKSVEIGRAMRPIID